MKIEDYNNISIGDIVKITQCGLNKGKICRVISISTAYGCTESVELELVNPHEVFLCRPYIGKTKMICKNYVHMTLIEKEP